MRRPRVALRSALALSTTLALSATTPAAWAQAEVPKPEKGRFAVAAVALLQHTNERCSSIASRLSNYWRRLSGDSETRQAQLDHYVLTKATADLTAARKALDLARPFLGPAAHETSPTTGAALERLFDAETALCNAVTQPSLPLSSFQSRLDEVEAEVEAAESELGSLLALPLKQELLKAVEPYLGIIERAAGVAQEEMLADLRSIRTEPEPPTEQELMEQWHQGYAQAVLPSKLALRGYLEGRRDSDAKAIQKSCKDLLARVIPLLAQPEVFRAPDPGVEEPLSLAFKAMRRLAGHCTSGRFDQADREYGKLQTYLSQSITVLSQYSLRP